MRRAAETFMKTYARVITAAQIAAMPAIAPYQIVKRQTSLQNVGNVHYLDQGLGYTATNGTTVKGSTVPALGMPFWATFGLRAHI